MSSRAFTFLVLLFFLAAGLGGCSDGQVPALPPIPTIGALPSLPALPSAEDARGAVCQSLASINSGVGALANVDATTTVNEIKALRGRVDTWVQAAKAANQVLNQPNIADMTRAYDDLALQINGLPDGAALSQSATANLRSGVAGVQTALAEARTALACP